MVEYAEYDFITSATRTETPKHRSATGYGRKIPTSWLVDCADGSRRRVYAICFSNAASSYILVNGKRLFIKNEYLYFS